MDKYRAMEEKLHRLVPVALSSEAQQRMEDTIDDLIGVDHEFEAAAVAKLAVSEPVFSGAFSRIFSTLSDGLLQPIVMAKAALIIGVVTLSVLVMRSQSDTDRITLAHVGISGEDSELLLLSSVSHVEGIEDDGVIYPDDGTAPHYRYRYKVLHEDEVVDALTGTVVTVLQPSYEVVTIPQKIY